MDRIRNFLVLALLALPALARSAPHCPELAEISGHWEMTTSENYVLCQFNSAERGLVLKAFFAAHPGIPTYGFNFYRITQANGRSYIWFSDRGANGQSKNIARTFMASGDGKLPVLMLWFAFDSQTDFDRKADLVAQLKTNP
jgi:hypothetical protein